MTAAPAPSGTGCSPPCWTSGHAPAAELAAAYARRWAVETCFAELKARLRGPGRVLRSRTPDLALQEIWAYLAVYQAVRAVIARTAAGAGANPARLSFTAALRAVRAIIRASPAAALASAEAALAGPVPERPGRVGPAASASPAPPTPQPPAPKTPYHATRPTPSPSPRPPSHPQPRQPAQNSQKPGKPRPLTSWRCAMACTTIHYLVR